MKLRRVGNTDLTISEIGFGCGGNAGLMVRGTAAEQERAVGHALDCGMTYFDNAPDYGAGVAEENLGRALQALKARPTITTKVEIRAENLSDIANHMERSVEDSLRRLRVDVIDVLQIHNGPVAKNPNLEGKNYHTIWIEDYLRPGGVIEGVHRLLKAGKIRFSGFVSRGHDAAETQTILETGLFHILNLPYTLLNPTAGLKSVSHGLVTKDYGNILARAKAAGAGSAIISPLAGGLLTDILLSGQQTHPLARPKDVDALAEQGKLDLARSFQTLAQRQGMSLVEMAYRFILSNPDVTTILGGFSALSQIDDAVGAASLGPLSNGILADIAALWR